jgi:hypothetical protein
MFSVRSSINIERTLIQKRKRKKRTAPHFCSNFCWDASILNPLASLRSLVKSIAILETMNRGRTLFVEDGREKLPLLVVEPVDDGPAPAEYISEPRRGKGKPAVELAVAEAVVDIILADGRHCIDDDQNRKDIPLAILYETRQIIEAIAL